MVAHKITLKTTAPCTSSRFELSMVVHDCRETSEGAAGSPKVLHQLGPHTEILPKSKQIIDTEFAGQCSTPSSRILEAESRKTSLRSYSATQ